MPLPPNKIKDLIDRVSQLWIENGGNVNDFINSKDEIQYKIKELSFLKKQEPNEKLDVYRPININICN
jgi:hypothetical protein